MIVLNKFIFEYFIDVVKKVILLLYCWLSFKSENLNIYGKNI